MPRLWRTEKMQMEKRDDAIDLRRRQDRIPASIAEKKGRIPVATRFLAAENLFFGQRTSYSIKIGRKTPGNATKDSIAGK